MKAILNEKSLVGIREAGKTRLLRNYKEFSQVDVIQVGKDDLRITARMEISEDYQSRIHLQLADNQNRIFTASIIPSSDGNVTFLKFGNKMLGNPSLFLMNLLPSMHLLSDTQKEEVRKALSRELSASEQEEKELKELYSEWYVNQITIQKRSASKVESFQEWFDTVYQNVLESMEVEKIQDNVKTSDLAEELGNA